MRDTMKRILSILMFTTILSGCVTTQVIDYDGENISEEDKQRMMDDGGVEYTEEIVTLQDMDNVSIMAAKLDPIITFERDYDVKQDRWNITAYNDSEEDLCVTLLWKLMDYQLISEYPSEFLVKHQTMVTVGTMIQQVWEIQGVKFTPDGSGYLADMLVREPVEGAKQDEECIFFEKEEDIVER